MPDPFSARRRAGRARWRRWRWGLAVVVAIAALVVYLGVFSPVLVVKDVQVTGADEQVARMARENADVDAGRPLARVDTQAVADRVSADTRIKTVEVSRGWPSTITIDLTLRQPRAVLTQPEEPAMLVDGSGVAYEGVAQSPEDLPKIAAPAGSVARESLAGALRARSALERTTRDQVSSMELTADGDLSFSLGSLVVVWGQPEAHDDKADSLEALLSQAGIDPDGERALTLDVTAPQTPVVSGLPPAEPD